MQIQLIEKWMCWGSVVAFGTLLCAHILILPPYEGFDETAHYSYISFLADKHQIPTLGITPLDQTLDFSQSGLPQPYLSEPPFEQNNGITYKTFFNQFSDEERELVLRNFWSIPNNPVSFIPDKEKNWEAQHPPLFYALMVIPYRLSSNQSAGIRLFWLRLFSVLFTICSAIFWIKSVYLIPDFSRYFVVIGGLIILFFPSLFFDLARLGNDGLTAFLFSGVFYFLFACLYQDVDKRFRNFLYLSVLLGLGLLTKLFFLPIAIGAIGFYIWLERDEKRIAWRVLLTHLAVCFSTIFVIAGWWYIFCFYQYGALFISDEMMRFRNIDNPIGNHLSVTAFLFQLLRNFGSFWGSFLWSGTWSWIRRPLVSYLLWGPLFLLILSGFYSLVKQRKVGKSFWFVCFFLIIPLLLGFIYHMYIRVKFTGFGAGTGGYYLFIAWPVLGCLVALSFENSSRIWKYCLVVAFGCLLIFEINGWWILLQVYAGVIEKAGNIKTGIGAINLTPGNLQLVLDRLKGLVFPYSATIFYLCAIKIKILLVVTAIFRYPHPVVEN